MHRTVLDGADEWYAHRELGLKAGLAPAIIDAIAQGKRPASLSREELAIYDFVSELLTARKVSDTAFAAVREAFGLQGIVDLIGTIGYYSLVAMTLNVNQTAVPPDAVPLAPLEEH